jgi:TP53 regulating kinase-like protein
MVSFDPHRLVEWVRGQELIGMGAEAEVYCGVYGGLEAVFKLRPPKPYRHPRLDSQIRATRTRKEAKLTIRARRGGVPAPAVLAVYPSAGLIVFEFIRGSLLRDYLDVEEGRAASLARAAGSLLGLLHRAGVAHGDYTTSNLIVAEGRLHVIDFGLAEADPSIEERAVDIHLFRRSLESAHARIAGEAYEAFVEGYISSGPPRALEAVRRAEEIRLMGRYVAERRSVWGG